MKTCLWTLPCSGIMDTISRERRSENMRRIKSTGMRPEMAVRKLAHAMGYRYRLHVPGLPGRPDMVFSKRRKVIFVHGCFWHQHPKASCADARYPKSNLSYWRPKLERNVQRDRSHAVALTKSGWKVLIIWECETGDENILCRRLRAFLGPVRTESADNPAGKKSRSSGNG